MDALSNRYDELARQPLPGHRFQTSWFWRLLPAGMQIGFESWAELLGGFDAPEYRARRLMPRQPRVKDVENGGQLLGFKWGEDHGAISISICSGWVMSIVGPL